MLDIRASFSSSRLSRPSLTKSEIGRDRELCARGSNLYYTYGNIKASGKKRLISINNPAKTVNHKLASTGAVDK